MTFRSHFEKSLTNHAGVFERALNIVRAPFNIKIIHWTVAKRHYFYISVLFKHCGWFMFMLPITFGTAAPLSTIKSLYTCCFRTTACIRGSAAAMSVTAKLSAKMRVLQSQQRTLTNNCSVCHVAWFYRSHISPTRTSIFSREERLVSPTPLKQGGHCRFIADEPSFSDLFIHPLTAQNRLHSG